MEIDQIKAAIISGDYDDSLASLKDAVKYRQKQISEGFLYTLKKGSKAKVGGLRQPNINGKVVEVIKVNRTTVSVIFGEDAGRYAGACKVPGNCLFPVDA